MRCLLLISVALWSLVSAIPKRDLLLIKEVETLTESTYKMIMQEILDFNSYKTKLALECKALDSHQIVAKRWQDSLDYVSSISRKRNLTEDEIEDFVEQLDYKRITFVPPGLILLRLVQCTNGTYLERYSTHILRSVEFLESFERQVIPNVKSMSDAVKQMDLHMYEAFLAFIYSESGNRETAFKEFRTKIMRYDDRVILTEVRALEAQMRQPYMQLLLNTTIYTAESIVNCKLVKQTEIDTVNSNLSFVQAKNQNLTDDEIFSLSNTINLQVIPMDPENRASVLQRLIQCTNGIYAQKKRNTNQQRSEYIKAFKTKIISKMQQVSQATRQSNAKLFKYYEDFVTATDENGQEIYFYLFLKELRVF